MAGHSKFKNIMHRKGRQDAARGKIFTKLAKEIIIAAKGGADPSHNPRLRAAIAAAKAENMPKDKIETAVKKGSGELESEALEEIRYEGYANGGVALIVEALTDNRNRTAAEVRSAFTKHGGNLGETGSVNFMFDHVGYVEYPKDVADDETMFEAALEAGADNCESNDETHEITCAADDLSTVRDALAEQFGDPTKARLIWQAQTPVAVDEDQAGALLKLLEALEDNDDVQEVYGNYEIDDAVMERLAS